MVRKTFTPEQIINKLREAEIHISQGIPIAEASFVIAFCTDRGSFTNRD